MPTKKSPTPQDHVKELIDTFIVSARGHRKPLTAEDAKINVLSRLNRLAELPPDSDDPKVTRERKSIRQYIRIKFKKYPWMREAILREVSL